MRKIPVLMSAPGFYLSVIDSTNLMAAFLFAVAMHITFAIHIAILILILILILIQTMMNLLFIQIKE